MPVNSFDDHPLSWRPRRDAPGGGPVYLALAAQLADDIAAGLLPPGAKLPPQRELADYLDIDFTTVTRAYGVCRERGLIYGVISGWDAEKCMQFGWASGVMAASSLNDYAEPADEKQVWDVYAGNARVQR